MLLRFLLLSLSLCYLLPAQQAEELDGRLKLLQADLESVSRERDDKRRPHQRHRQFRSIEQRMMRFAIGRHEFGSRKIGR